jgi:hypothetical protein
LKISPVPVENSLEIEFRDSKSGLMSINLMDISGILIKNLEKNVLYEGNQLFNKVYHLEDVSNGTYFLNIIINGKRFYRKIMIFSN